jgi:GMP synthase (glutamine-hydrolysing)
VQTSEALAFRVRYWGELFSSKGQKNMTTASPTNTVLVLDFGAQYGQLIARRVRDLKVYSEIVPCDISADEVRAKNPAALILSGGPASVYAEDAPSVDPEIFNLGLPVLGFCYGQQIMAKTLGGEVGHTEKGEYGPAPLTRVDGGESVLYGNSPEAQTVWMSHRDAVSRVPEGFVVTAKTDVCPVASMECASRKLYATQFHPEVRHTPYGQDMLSNFLFKVAGLEANWTMDSIIEDSVAAIREQVGANRVILGLSGGVDSSVVAALCAKAIGKQLVCVFVNHGLLRKNEPEEVEEVFTKQFDVDFIHVHAEERYAALLAGVTEPEKKRRIIGEQFWKEFFAVAEEVAGDGEPVKFLAQGTIYPDIIESGARKTGGKASTIKSHHNLIPFPDGVHFDLIEPLDHFFKDEVRALGSALGLPDHIVHRQPFPGPGLAIRIIGEVTPEKLEILKNADAIVREELDAYNETLFERSGERNGEVARTEAGGPEVERSVWQYFAVLPDIKSVGVMGDERTYARPIILRAVESSDAMTADWAKLPYDVLARVSSRIVAEVPGVNRVAYDITSKPPATIEWE